MKKLTVSYKSFANLIMFANNDEWKVMLTFRHLETARTSARAYRVKGFTTQIMKINKKVKHKYSRSTASCRHPVPRMAHRNVT